MPDAPDRKAIADAAVPPGLDGIEFIEFATSKPQALGQVRDAAAAYQHAIARGSHAHA